MYLKRLIYLSKYENVSTLYNVSANSRHSGKNINDYPYQINVGIQGSITTLCGRPLTSRVRDGLRI